MNIYALTTLEIGIDSLNILIRNLPVKGVIGLSKRNAGDKISGYKYLKPYCDKKGLEFTEVKSYTLKNEKDKARILSLDIDILLVIGWQRLIPAWLIDHCKICAVGAHGSVDGITGGRGRSPQNWALILGKDRFYISIFKIDSGIDSGEVIDTRFYPISKTDDIKTSYYKVSLLTTNMIIENIKNGRISDGNLDKQEGEPKYLPQRKPEDGYVDWNRNSDEVYDFIRALTKPYPGARSRIQDIEVAIFKARPLDVENQDWNYKFGEIVNCYNNGDILVKTRDSFLLIEDYEVVTKSQTFQWEEGLVFESVSFKNQISSILNRHYQKNPDLEVVQDLEDIGK